jgi:predicted O-linked N-acetylglucosamine transferase (SPINDLY family)
MSIPIVTYPGASLPSRMAAALLRGAGWGELVAPDADGFVDLAIGLASDPAVLADLRTEIRARFLASPLCDTEDFAREIGDCYRRIYEWIAAKPGMLFELPA